MEETLSTLWSVCCLASGDGAIKGLSASSSGFGPLAPVEVVNALLRSAWRHVSAPGTESTDTPHQHAP